MDMSEKIKLLRIQNHMTLEELGGKVGVGKSTVRKWETGMIANMRRDKIAKLAAALGVSPAYLMGWEEAPPPYENVKPISTRSFPVLGAVACGEPILMTGEKEVYVDATTDIHADFVLIAHGDSMVGARIHDGDIVFVRSQDVVENGEIAVVAIDDEATLKRFYRYGELIVLRAENPAFKDLEYKESDAKNVRILGKAVAFQSDLK